MELKKDYNHYNCIYKLISPSGKCYIGQCKDFNARQKRRLHSYDKWLVNGGKAENPALFNAFKTYGVENFIHEILEENIKTQDELDEKEIYYIDFFDCIHDGYNIALGGAINSINPLTGRGYTYGKSKIHSIPYSDDPNAWKREDYQLNKEKISAKNKDRYENRGGREKRKSRYLVNSDKEKAASRKHYSEHKEECLEYRHDYYEENREECLQASRDYYEKNKEEMNAKAKKKREEDHEEYLFKLHEYRDKNSEKIRQDNIRYREKNHEKILEKDRLYKLNNPDKIKERMKIDVERRRWLNECDKEFYGKSSTGFWFRRFFGEGRTHTKYFMKPKNGYVNSQGCWLFPNLTK